MAALKANRLIPLFALLLFFCCQSVYLANRYSTTNDEGFHIKAGGLYLLTGEFAGGFHNPPMLQAYLGLADGLGWERFDVFGAIPPVLARYLNIALGCLLGLAVYFVASRYSGHKGGLFALGLYAISPSLTAHSALATTDLGITLCLFLFVALLAATEDNESMSALMLTGAALGIAVASKLTALSFVALMPFLYLGRAWLTKRVLTANVLKQVLRNVFVVSLMVYLVLSASYGFKGVFTSKSYIVPTRPWLMATMYPLPKLAAEAIVGKMSFARSGCASYLLGKKYRAGTIWFYPGVFLVKLPLGTVLFVLLTLAAILWEPSSLLSRKGLYLFIPPAFLLVSMTLGNRHQTGVRHLFPMFPFIFVGAGTLLSNKRKMVPLVALIILLNVGGALSVFPEGLSYVNSLGYRLSSGPLPLSGPDLDWGQSDLVLRSYLKTLPKDEDKWVNPYPNSIPVSGWIAVSACSRIYGAGSKEKPYQWLEHFPLKLTVGGAWSVFHIPKEAYSELAKKHSDDWLYQKLHLDYLYGNGHFEQCAEAGRKLVKKFPGALFHIGKALLLAGDYQGSQETFKALAISAGGKLQGQAAIWQEISTFCAGKHPKPEREARAFSYTVLNILDKSVTDPLKKRLLAHPQFKEPVSPGHPDPWQRFAWALIHREKNEWKEQLALLSTLTDFAFQPFVERAMKPVISIAESTMTKRPRVRNKKLVHASYDPYWTEYILKDFKRRFEKDPLNYDYIVSIILVQMKRRAEWIGFDGGTGTLYDELERNGRWRGEK